MTDREFWAFLAFYLASMLFVALLIMQGAFCGFCQG